MSSRDGRLERSLASASNGTVEAGTACYDPVFRRSRRGTPSGRVSPSSRGPGRGPFKAKTRVRIPLGTPDLPEFFHQPSAFADSSRRRRFGSNVCTVPSERRCERFARSCPSLVRIVSANAGLSPDAIASVNLRFQRSNLVGQTDVGATLRSHQGIVNCLRTDRQPISAHGRGHCVALAHRRRTSHDNSCRGSSSLPRTTRR
jgi:hypothetical protein